MRLVKYNTTESSRDKKPSQLQHVGGADATQHMITMLWSTLMRMWNKLQHVRGADATHHKITMLWLSLTRM